MTTPYYGAPQGRWPPRPYGPPQPHPPRSGHRVWLFAVLTVVVLAIAGGVSAYVVYEQHQNSDSSKIKALVDDFSRAVGTGDSRKIAGLMCAEEAGAFLDNVQNSGGAVAGAENPPFEITDITVHGDVASATLKFRGSETQKIFFRKQNGRWTVCAPAKSQM